MPGLSPLIGVIWVSDAKAGQNNVVIDVPVPTRGCDRPVCALSSLGVCVCTYSPMNESVHNELGSYRDSSEARCRAGAVISSGGLANISESKV
jgi:hypothetical protein